MPINYKKYPPNWKSEIRPRILKRAKNKCEKCRVNNGAKIFRGIWRGIEIYQYRNGRMYSYPDGSLVCENSFLETIQPISEDKAIRIVLTIAHLDHDPENWNVKDNRLSALCQKCHLRYDAVEKSRKAKEKKYKKSLFPLK